MLLSVMATAKADHPSVRWLQAGAAVGANSYVGAFNREPVTARNRAMMAPHPSSMGWTTAYLIFSAQFPDTPRKSEIRHGLPRPHESGQLRRASWLKVVRSSKLVQRNVQ